MTPYVIEKRQEEFEWNKKVAAMLLMFLTPKEREPYNAAGIAIDEIAEIVVAKSKKSMVVNGHGFDLSDNTEVKYARYTCNGRKANHWRAKIGNLNRKRNRGAELDAIISMTGNDGNLRLRFFRIPSEIWEKNVTNNSMAFSLQTNSWKWYMDYEMTAEEFGLKQYKN